MEFYVCIHNFEGRNDPFMIQSMTGYGKAEKLTDLGTVKAELRSLNGKFFDLNLRIPPSVREKESVLRNILSEKLERGKIDFILTLGNSDSSAGTINVPLAKTYYAQLRSLAKDLNLEKKNLMPQILQMPDVMGSAKTELNDSFWKEIETVVSQAAEDLVHFRMREGGELQTALSNHVSFILQYLAAVQPYESERIQNIRNNLLNSLQQVKDKPEVDANRLEQELIYYLERMDFTEEKVRLTSHCDFFLKTMSEMKSNGRRLSFISQEMGREINTLGSKANHAEIQKLVVMMKDELEKIKEQLMNVL